MQVEVTRTYQLNDLSEKEIILLAQAMTALIGAEKRSPFHGFALEFIREDAVAQLLEQRLRSHADEVPF